MNTENNCPEYEKLIEAIWEKHEKEMLYWVMEHLNGFASNNVGIHQVENFDGQYVTIIHNQDDGSAVLIMTDTRAPTVEDSHKYMLVEPQVIAKIGEIATKSKKGDDE